MSTAPNDYAAAGMFRKELEEYLSEYQKHLLTRYKKSTVTHHSYVLNHCIDYLYGYHGVEGFEQITFGMVSSKVYYDFISNTHDPMSRQSMLNIIRKFFEYISDYFGVSNPVLMKKIAAAKV